MIFVSAIIFNLFRYAAMFNETRCVCGAQPCQISFKSALEVFPGINCTLFS